MSTASGGSNPTGDSRFRQFFSDHYHRVVQDPAHAPDPRIAAALSLESVEAQSAALEKLREEAIATAEVTASQQQVHRSELDKSIKKIKEYYAVLDEGASKTPYPRGIAAGKAYAPDWDPSQGQPQQQANAPIQPNTNLTQEQVAAQQQQTTPGVRGMRVRDAVRAVAHGEMGVTQAALMPVANMLDTLKFGALQTTVNPATGQIITNQRVPGKVLGSRGGALAAKGLQIGAGTLGGMYAFSQGIPYALEGVQQAYNNIVGNEITYGQQAGFAGTQGAGAFGTGLANRLFEPVNLIGGAFGMPQIGPFGSPAAQFGSQRRLEAFRAGFNPFDNLSIREAESIQQEVLGRGYRAGSQQERGVIKALNRLKNTTGIDPGQALDYMDIMVKRFGVSTDTVVDDIETFAEAAQAAGKSINEFTKEVSEVTLNLTESGVAPREAASIARGFSAIEGVPGQAAAGVANPQSGLFLMNALQRHPDLLNSPAQMMLYMQNPAAALGGDVVGDVASSVKRYMQMLVDPMAGSENMTLEQKAEILKGYPIPGLEDLSARQIAAMIRDGADMTSTQARTDSLNELQAAYSAYQETTVTPYNAIPGLAGKRGPGASPDAQKALDALYDKYMQTVNQSDDLTDEQRSKIRDMVKRREDPKKIEEQVGRFIKDTNAGRDVDQQVQQNRLTIDASPELQRFFRFIDQGGNTNYLGGEDAYTASERNRNRPTDLSVWGRRWGHGIG